MAFHPLHRLNVPLNIVWTTSLLVPLLGSTILPSCRLSPFTPRQIIYSRDLVPLFLAPWVSPTSLRALVSRVLQAGLLGRLASRSASLCYGLWIVIAIARTVSGFVLSRSVGWAYPQLFSHWALYETSGGVGAALLSCLLLGQRPWTDAFVRRLSARHHEGADALIVVCLGSLLCFLDSAPWTYAMACLASTAILLGHIVHRACSLKDEPSEYQSLPLNHGRESPPEAGPSRVSTAFLSLVAIVCSSLIVSLLHPPSLPLMPPSPRPPAPLLEILILSFPRPHDVASPASILATTIASYLPFLQPETVGLSVFTHATTHESFAHAAEHFAHAGIEFHTDADEHPDAVFGQYLHIAEAFRWVAGKGARQAEWVMLVEDDFPVCGRWGWRGVRGVMAALEQGRHVVSGDTVLDRRGGFVGTGGSGLIVHRSLLPILIHLLRTHANAESPLPSALAPRPADLVIQDCLLGNDPSCPRRSVGGTLVITSRLAMDHIGGTSSTAEGRSYDEGKWRCGWRHPFHGRSEVEVIVI